MVRVEEILDEYQSALRNRKLVLPQNDQRNYVSSIATSTSIIVNFSRGWRHYPVAGNRTAKIRPANWPD
jgi:hypothetical protein